MIDFDSIFDRKIIITRIHRFNSFLMKPLHSLVTAALFFTSCASTPEQIRRKERADRVAALANSAGAHFGLSPLERVMLERKARQIG